MSTRADAARAQRTSGFLEPDQIATICAALPVEVRAVVKFSDATGWRTASEVLPLEWRNVDWAGHCVRLDAHTTKNGEARSFPFTTEIETVLKTQLAEHERLKAAGTICPFVFNSNGERIKTFRTAWKNACKAAGCPGKLIHDMRRSTVRTFERAGVCRDRSRCRLSATRPSRSIAAMRSSTKRCSAKRPHDWTPGWLFLRQRHQPLLLLSFDVVESSAASVRKSGHPTTAQGVDTHYAVTHYRSVGKPATPIIAVS
jgi:Phage integrase family